MSGLVVPAFYPAMPAQPSVAGVSLPVAIDYPAALALRQMALVHDELPKYLLAPEISALLHYVPDLHRKLLLASGGRRFCVADPKKPIIGNPVPEPSG